MAERTSLASDSRTWPWRQLADMRPERKAALVGRTADDLTKKVLAEVRRSGDTPTGVRVTVEVLTDGGGYGGE